MHVYSSQIEKQMVNLYGSLSEKDRRRYAAVEAAKLGHGGTASIAELFGCDPDTIRQGRQDVEQLPEDEAASRTSASVRPPAKAWLMNVCRPWWMVRVARRSK